MPRITFVLLANVFNEMCLLRIVEVVFIILDCITKRASQREWAIDCGLDYTTVALLTRAFWTNDRTSSTVNGWEIFLDSEEQYFSRVVY